MLPRTVIREHDFDDELRALISDEEDADRYVEGAEFLLARDPLIGTATTTAGVWGLPMAPIDGNEIALYYTFDASTVWLLFLARTVVGAKEIPDFGMRRLVAALFAAALAALTPAGPDKFPKPLSPIPPQTCHGRKRPPTTKRGQVRALQSFARFLECGDLSPLCSQRPWPR